MAGLAFVAGGAGGDADARIPQHPHHHLALIPGQGDGADVGGVPLGDDLQLGQRLVQLLEGVGLDGGGAGEAVSLGHGGLTGGGKPGDLGGGLGARAHAVFLPASGEVGGETDPLFHQQGANALGGSDLVATHRHKVCPQGRHGVGYLQKALDGVTVEQNGLVIGLHQLHTLGHREHGTNLVVHQHHGHQGGVRAQGGGQVLGVDAALPIRLEIGHLVTLTLQVPAGLQHGGVLNGGGDDVLALPAVQLHTPADGPVVALGAAGGKIHLLGGTAQSTGHRLPVGLHPLGGLSAQRIAGGGVAKVLQGLHHGLHGLGGDGGGGGIIEVSDGHRYRPSYINIIFANEQITFY